MIIQFADTKVHIKDLQYGVVVEKIYDNGQRTFGHIVGFTNLNGIFRLIVKFNYDAVAQYPTDLIFNIE